VSSEPWAIAPQPVARVGAVAPSALAAAQDFAFVANAHRERHVVQRWPAPTDGTEAVPAELINRATPFTGTGSEQVRLA